MIIKPPSPAKWPSNKRAVFLAGSIEMGTATNWQEVVETAVDHAGLVALNPRRDDWDASWEQSASNPPFREQVLWELDALARADVIAMYFVPETKSPITLLELGLHAAEPHKLVVCCPDGFWRKGNVDLVCERAGVLMVRTLPALIGETLRRCFAPPTVGSAG